MKTIDKQWFIHGTTTASDGDAKDEQVQKSVLAAQGLDCNKLITCNQVHGDKIAIVTNEQTRVFPDTDGLVTDVPGLVLNVFTADCVPIFLCEPNQKVIGVLHSGWRGTVNLIAKKAVELMCLHWNAAPEMIQVWIGPHIQTCCYEAGPEVAKLFPKDCIVQNGQKQKISLQKAIGLQLIESGVIRKNIHLNKSCTFSDPGFFSYRKDKTKARMMAYISKVI